METGAYIFLNALNFSNLKLKLRIKLILALKQVNTNRCLIFRITPSLVLIFVSKI